jgi:hypothetical protein
VPAYSSDRDILKKPEKEFKDFFGGTFSEEKITYPAGFRAKGSPLPIYKWGDRGRKLHSRPETGSGVVFDFGN